MSQATTEVFTTMLQLKLTAGLPYTRRDATHPAEGVLSLVGLAGQWIGTGGIACSAPTACRLAGQFLMSEFAAVNDEVLDALGELTNIIVGTLKTALQVELGPMALSVPMVICGSSFRTRSAGSAEWLVVPFVLDDDTLRVQLCLTPARQTAPLTDGAQAPDPLL